MPRPHRPSPCAAQVAQHGSATWQARVNASFNRFCTADGSSEPAVG
jgi:hypothetical protein